MSDIQFASRTETIDFNTSAQVSIHPMYGCYLKGEPYSGSEHTTARRIEVLARQAFILMRHEELDELHRSGRELLQKITTKEDNLSLVEKVIYFIANALFFRYLGNTIDDALSVSKTYLDIDDFCTPQNIHLFIQTVNELNEDDSMLYFETNFRSAPLPLLLAAIDQLAPEVAQ